MVCRGPAEIPLVYNEHFYMNNTGIQCPMIQILPDEPRVQLTR